MAWSLSILRDPSDRLADEPPVQWAIGELQRTLTRRGIVAHLPDGAVIGQDQTNFGLLIAGTGSPAAGEVLRSRGISIPPLPEAFGLVPGRPGDAPPLLACGSDVRGLVYAVLELVDRVVHAEDPRAALMDDSPIVERPANPIRGVARLLTSEVYDKPWFHDESFWGPYLTELVAQRFNRVSLTLGLGYNFPRHITDSYLYFPYPFLVPVPGYQVRVPQLRDEERERNLRALRFASDQATARGLHFQLGLWTHAYEWSDSPNATYTIEGLTPDKHAAYCRDALDVLLTSCPGIQGLTFRIHGEGGVPEGSWGFWKTVFEGAVHSGRPVELDLHAKGIDRQTIDAALETGLPVNLSAKFWAEHMGLPYHQAAIRELERTPHESASDTEWGRFMSVSEGSRRFTRYGYADLLSEDRPYGLFFRLWPGTQRLLLWGDPRMAAAYGRASSLTGCLGIEWCEPLSFRGREGSAVPGPRDGYTDRTLHPTGGDWEKYTYAYRLLGRLTYNPDAAPETWRRYLRAEFGPAAHHAEAALANASRILPLVTTAHHPSASNNYYWPEMYTNMPIVWRGDKTHQHPYIDTPPPRRFGTVSPLDPELFSSVEEFVEEAASSKSSGRYSPIDVAGWLEAFARAAAGDLNRMEVLAADPNDPSFRRWVIDVAIQAALGQFFAGKLRAGVGYALYGQTGSMEALREALLAYRAAREAWVSAADGAKGRYLDDLTFGPEPWLRGHWRDRLPAIDQDITDMENELAKLESAAAVGSDVPALPQDATKGDRWSPRVHHHPPTSFRRGAPVPIELVLHPDGSGPRSLEITIRYRHLNQSEPYSVLPMEGHGRRYSASIPGEYTNSPYPIQYFFVCRDAYAAAWLYPGLSVDSFDQPYFVVLGLSMVNSRSTDNRKEEVLCRSGGWGVSAM